MPNAIERGLPGLADAIGAPVPYADYLPQGVRPVALEEGQARRFLGAHGKDPGLAVLGALPMVAETPEHLLDDDTTPIEKFFVRNNGLVPERVIDADSWEVRIEGEVRQALSLTVGVLKQKFAHRTYRMVMECGGNGRSFFAPPARGNPWTNGGVGCAEWTGVALADVLHEAGLTDAARFTGSHGADPHLSGDVSKDAMSRGNTIAKALEPHTLLVWAMNGVALPHLHGGPLRLIVPGWPGSLSTKWVNRIVVRATPHDGQGMGGTSYRVPTSPIVPGSEHDGADFRELESMPVRSIITSPASGQRLPSGTRDVALRGAAWAGDFEVARVEISVDFGRTWHAARLAPPRNRYDWVRWSHDAVLPADGYFEAWARAVDSAGEAQPMVATNWNPQGYGANPINRVAVLIG